MGTKIVVVQLKELIKTAVFAVVGIALIVLLIYLFIPKNDEAEASYMPGTYSAEIILHNNPVLVQVTVSENEIASIELLNMGETQEVFYPLFQTAIDELSEEIINSQSLDVALSSDKSMTEQILIKAVDKALEQARIAE